MLSFIKKLFGAKPAEVAVEAPYKVEEAQCPVMSAPVVAEVKAEPVKAAKAPAKKPAAKKAPAKKPATAKKPAAKKAPAKKPKAKPAQ